MKDLFAYRAWRRMRSGRRTIGIARSRSVAAILLAGGIGIAITTWACFQLRAGFGAVGFIYLIEVVLLSMMGSFLASAGISLIAVCCLNFFFASPVLSFRLDAQQDVIALTAFL